VRHEVGDRHVAGEHKGDRAREQAERQHRTPCKLEHACTHISVPNAGIGFGPCGKPSSL
jgi:hypothetical protein